MSLVLALLAMAAPASTPYRAQGSGHPWSLTIADGRMRYDEPGEPSVSVETPPAEVNGRLLIYARREIAVLIFDRGCTDAATGRRYADTVTVAVRLTELHGCGGSELPADSLNGTSWHFAEIAGEETGLTGDMFKDQPYFIDFDKDAFDGYFACSRVTGDYKQEKGIVTIKAPLRRMRWRCGEPKMSRERKLFAIVNGPLHISFPDKKTMLMTGDAGMVRLVRSTSY